MNPLDLKIEGGNLVLTIGVDTLAFAAQQGDYWPQTDMMVPAARITDAALFASEVVTELGREAEDGTTLVHLMFDKAIQHALDNGALSVDYDL